MRTNNFFFQNFSKQFSTFSERFNDSICKALNISNVFLRIVPFFSASAQFKKSSESILRSEQGRSEGIDNCSFQKSILKTKRTHLKKRVHFEDTTPKPLGLKRKTVHFKNTELDSLSTSSTLKKKCTDCFHMVLNRIKGFSQKENPIFCPIVRADELKEREICYSDGSSSVQNTIQKKGYHPDHLFTPLLNTEIVTAHRTSPVIRIRDYWGV